MVVKPGALLTSGIYFIYQTDQTEDAVCGDHCFAAQVSTGLSSFEDGGGGHCGLKYSLAFFSMRNAMCGGVRDKRQINDCHAQCVTVTKVVFIAWAEHSISLKMQEP